MSARNGDGESWIRDSLDEMSDTDRQRVEGWMAQGAQRATDQYEARLRRYRRRAIGLIGTGMLIPFVAGGLLWGTYTWIENEWSLYQLSPLEVCYDAGGMTPLRHFDADGVRTVICMDPVEYDFDWQGRFLVYDLVAYDQARSAWWPVPERYDQELEFVNLQEERDRDRYLGPDELERAEHLCVQAGGALVGRVGGELKLDLMADSNGLWLEGAQEHVGMVSTWCENEQGKLFIIDGGAPLPEKSCEAEFNAGSALVDHCTWTDPAEDLTDHIEVIAENAEGGQSSE